MTQRADLFIISICKRPKKGEKSIELKIIGFKKTMKLNMKIYSLNNVGKTEII
jgi:hypothetical protein